MPFNNEKAAEIVEALGLLAGRARKVGAPVLGALIDQVVEMYKTNDGENGTAADVGSFADGLRGALRQDPDAILVAETGGPLDPREDLDEDTRASVERGLEQSADGDVTDLGDFAAHAAADPIDALRNAVGNFVRDFGLDAVTFGDEDGNVTGVVHADGGEPDDIAAIYAAGPEALLRRIADAQTPEQTEEVLRDLRGLRDQFGLPIPGDGDDEVDADPFAGLRDQINGIGQDVNVQVTPRTLTLITNAEGGVTVEEALEVAAMVTPSIAEVVKDEDEDAETALVIGEAEVTENGTTVILTLSEANTGYVLAAMGAEENVFEASIPLGEKTITVTSLTGAPADLDLARELGMAPGEDYEGLPEVPEGQHRINGALIVAEQMFGVRPQAATLAVTYRKDNGTELTEDQVRRIVDHPISQGGLRRLGDLALVEVVAGADPSAKVARFGVLAAGEIDPATFAIGAAAYRGTFNFGGDIGTVTANAETALADIEVPANF